MIKQNYHHGNLKETLIDKGLELLNQVGYEAFSMRKLATICGVSHSAPYRHFKDKDELISAIRLKALEHFKQYLNASLKYFSDPRELLKETGKQSVKFFVENPDYLDILILNTLPNNIKIQNNQVLFSDNPTINFLVENCLKCLESISVDQNDFMINVMSIGSMIYGLTILLVKEHIIIKDSYMDYVDKILSKLL
ncbi:TetR/AcrR family transcriptional regulator [Wukongibacter baidiensis]|uniref:TetR/AcrR family transcriptional regulator n=1 Tax=Wukongibacter baidiensis TaxID=1723361 RepID=UPI003D7F4A8A